MFLANNRLFLLVYLFLVFKTAHFFHSIAPLYY